MVQGRDRVQGAQQGAQRQLQGCRETHGEIVCNRLSGVPGCAQVPMQHVPHVVHKLLGNGIVEPHLLPQRRQRFRGGAGA